MSMEKAKEYEANRIKALREERERIQKKTFTKWMNSFLQRYKMEQLEVEDLFTDLSDGRRLLKLLEIISGEKLGKVNTSRHRIHKIENVNRSLAFLHTKVKLESIGSEDIVDGKPQLILGLIWTIILRFQIQPIRIPDAEDENSEKKSAKDALLLWCQRNTTGYRGVNICDFSNSWRNGLGFNALIHSHCPELINYAALDPNDHYYNLNHAFEVAKNELEIPQLLDAEDLVKNKEIDEKCVLTYVASYYHCLTKRRQKMMEGRRIANIVGQLVEIDHLKSQYERFAEELLNWIQAKIVELRHLDFPNSLEGIQGELLQFKEYRTIKKPPKYRERSEVEALLFVIQTKIKALGQPLYVPPEGSHVHDIGRAWAELERAEHQREVALREQLLHQEYLENLAYKFVKKSMVREGYLKEMTQVLSDPTYGSNLGQVEATIKKHEALSADIHLNWEERFKTLSAMADELVQKNYHGKEDIKQREQQITLSWHHLLELLSKHKQTLTKLGRLMELIREMDTISAELKELQGVLTSGELGRHLLGVEDLLESHTLYETQAASHGDAIQRLNNQASTDEAATGDHPEVALFQKKLQKLNQDYASLMEAAAKRRSDLLLSKVFFQFMQDHEEDEAWIIERQRICKAEVPGRDLQGALLLQRKHTALEQEVKGHWPLTQRVLETGEELVRDHHPQSDNISLRLDSLRKNWTLLQELWQLKSKQLEDTCNAYQYHADANETESWIHEKRQLVSSTDYGHDELSAQSLLQLHTRLESQIAAYSADIERLNTQAQTLIKAGIASLNMLEEKPEVVTQAEEEWTEEIVNVPVEEWVEDVVEREVVKEFVEEKRVPQVQALYNFTGQGIEIKKGEIMILLQKTNSDWWNIRKATGQDGFVPANYVKTIESRLVRKPVKRTVKVPEKRRIKTVVMKRQIIRKKKEKSPLKRSRASTILKETENVDQRQKNINNAYELLKQLSKTRHLHLEEAKNVFGFYTECEDFENWMKDKEKLLKEEDPKESVEVRKKKFENFLTELSASQQRIDDIDSHVEQFAKTGCSQLNAIKAHQKQLHQRWERLNSLKQEKERSLKGATSVELFNRTCDEAYEWMQEKLDKIDVDEIGRDLKTVQSLQRKHENVVRELAPVEDKFNRVNLLAEQVKTSYPSEKDNVSARQKELQNLWDKVKAKTADRRARLDESRGLQIFRNSAKNLLSWVSTVKQALNSDEPARDVATAENLLKKHQDLGDDIAAHEAEFEAVQHLGRSLLAKPREELGTTLAQLEEEQEAIHRGYQEKGDWLRQNLDLQLFSREADQIDSITNSHDAFLEYTVLGTTLDEVEALLKRHENFTNTLIAQEDRLRLFNEMADKLIAAHHYDSPAIDEKRHQVLARRKVVQDKAFQRRQLLLAAHSYQYFKAEVNEFVSWIQDKLKIVSDDSYKELTNLEAKLKKHEAFEAELKANEDRLHVLNTNGQILISEDHYAKEDIAEILKQPNHLWEELCTHCEERGQKLRQAMAQLIYNRTLVDARTKLDELEMALNSEDAGSDLRSVKQLLKKHQVLEAELSSWESKIQELTSLGEDMANQGHFDAANILKSIKAVKTRCHNLKEPCTKRRKLLEDSLRLHEFNAELAAELQWVKEHLPMASLQDLGQNLLEVQQLCNKHQKLSREVQGHQPHISKTLTTAATFSQHSQIIQSQKDLLENNWLLLCQMVEERQARLDLALKAHLFFNEANEIENWMNEKMDVLDSTDFGRDEDAAIKLLTKHKALELEIDTYTGLVTEITHQAQKMIDTEHPDSKVISNRMQVVQQQLKNMSKLANQRRRKLMESKLRHEYFRESKELEEWIAEQVQMATSEDYGHDYEHLLYLHSKFDDFKHRVLAGMERFNQCEELAKKQISNDSPFAEEIEQQQNHLSECWNNLLDHIEAREQKLGAAGEIHRFNRDVTDALARIHEKYTSISTDLGRDLNSVKSLIRKHEGLINDLVALEGQLQVLLDDSARLQEAFPGGNAEHIQGQQNLVLENWNALQERTAQRREELQVSLNFHRLLAKIRNLEGWALGVTCQLRTEEKVRDLASAQTLKSEHDQLKAEIEAREQEFAAIVQAGDDLLATTRTEGPIEIQDRIATLLAVREELLQTWHAKKIHLDQLCDLHFFLREAKQLDTLSSQQELYLSSSLDQATTVEEVDSLVKKHDAFEKLMLAQEEKLALLQEHGIKLLKQNHFESATIRKRLDEVTARRSNVKELSAIRKQRLSDALLYSQFKRDSSEAESWIEEKQKKLEAEQATGELVTLEEKMKQLQKHQAFQSELSAHSSNINAIKQKGEELLAKGHEASAEIHSQLDTLLRQWRQLLEGSAERGRGLEEAQDLLEFNLSADRMEAWIRDKELMIQAGERGEDYEHCLALQRKLDDVDSDMRLDESYVTNVNVLAGKLMRQDSSVQQRRDELNAKWTALQGALENYRAQLAGALVIHAFNRDIDDTSERINEKAIMLSVEDEGKSLQAVEALQSRHEAIERDMTAIEAKIKEHEMEAYNLINNYPDQASHAKTRIADLQEQWKKLMILSQTRKQRLAYSYTLQKFLEDLKKLESWVNSMIERMKSSELGTNIAEARDQLQLHEERKAEINGRQETFRSLRDFGHGLLQQKQDNEPSRELLLSSLEKLESLHSSLRRTWEERHQTLTQCYDLQVFKDLADQTESWLASKEAFFNNDDLGDSMSSIEVLLRNHTNFEKTMEAQDSLVSQVEERAAELLNKGHYEAATIEARRSAICSRRDRLREAALLRRNKLLESRALHTFLQHVYEVVGWINEKLQVASDENYRDPTNLLSKIQKHAAFESELAASQARIDAVTAEGEHLVSAGNFAADRIRVRLEELNQLWRECLSKALLKKERLQDAYQALQFSRLLDDLDAWMDDMENQLQSEDHGKDLTSVQALLKKHLLLEMEINNHSEKIEQVKEMTANFQASEHFLMEDIEERANQIIQRYQSLYEPAQIRRENLEDALLLQQFIRDAEDELSWIAEKTSAMSSSDLGDNLIAVQKLIKKHEVLEAEIQSHEPLVSTVLSKGRQLVRSQHFASSSVEEKVEELQTKHQQLKDLASVRKLRLSDSLESQTFYSEAGEVESWLQEKLPQLTSTDLGKDETSVLALIKKLEAAKRDTENYNNNVTKIVEMGSALVERAHFDSDNIKQKMEELQSFYSEVKELIDKRFLALTESQKFFSFMRDAEEVASWFREKMVIANSDDYGKDVEHVEILIQKFEDFMSTIQTGERNMKKVQETARLLIEENHPEFRVIREKTAELSQLHRELRESANARLEALFGAKQVHTFDRSADETIGWIFEKDAVVSSEEYGHDLESIQTLILHHEGFEQELAAVKEQVVALVEEANRLSSQFPSAAEHIESKRDEVTEIWTLLLEKAASRKDRLAQAEKLQAYFDEYRELMAWIKEMSAVISSDELAHDVSGSQTLLYRHRQRKAELETRKDALSLFQTTGERMIAEGHFMSPEIRDKLDKLRTSFEQLETMWEDHLHLYEQYLDAQIFKKDAEQLEAWLQTRGEPVLQDSDLGDSIAAVEELIHRHEDFMQTLEAQEDKLQALTRITKIEEAFQKKKAEEEERRKMEAQKREQERMDAMKRKEQNRILEERRREDDRRQGGSFAAMEDEDEKRHPMIRMGSQKSLTDTPFKRGESLMLSPTKAAAQINLKRSESAKLGPKRTASFSTRSRQAAPPASSPPPPVEIEGFVERKQELQNGGKRATVRSWKSYYTVLCGQLLCFFKDKSNFLEKQAAAPPVNLLQARCSKATDYAKKKHVIRIHLSDGAKFLLAFPDGNLMQDWLEKLSFHASLPPSMQLMSYESHKNAVSSSMGMGHLPSPSTESRLTIPESAHDTLSTASSQESSIPESSHPPPPAPRLVPPSYEQTLQMREKSSKPPVPPRTTPRVISEPVLSQSTAEGQISVRSRVQMFQNTQPPPIPARTSYPHSSSSGEHLPTSKPAIANNNNGSSITPGQQNGYPSTPHGFDSRFGPEGGSMGSQPPSYGPPTIPIKPPSHYHGQPITDSEEEWTSESGSRLSGTERRASRTNSEASDYSGYHRKSMPNMESPSPSYPPVHHHGTLPLGTPTATTSTTSLPADHDKKSRESTKRRSKFNLFRKKPNS